MIEPVPYSIEPARYAKGMMAVRCVGGDGWKTRAMYLAGYFARERYSGRERAYIMSRAAALKFEEAFASGWNASCFGGRKLIAPRAIEP